MAGGVTLSGLILTPSPATVKIFFFIFLEKLPARVYMFSTEWSISSLPNCIDPNPTIYLPPIEDPKVVCDTIFYERPPSKTRKIKMKPVVLDPYQMVSFKVKLHFKKWETILKENAVSLSRYKDHPNACMAYMLYCLTIHKPFNLAYYIAKRIESVTRSNVMVLPYRMLLTRLYRHVHTTYPFAISNIHYLVDHVMIPLTEGKARRIIVDGKRPHPQTYLLSSLSPSPTQNLEENDPVDNYTLDPIVFMNQLTPIEGGESMKFKQTKGMFKCFSHFLSNLGYKK
ncbi:hypothetical protein Tco_1018270 [Tanacetum coccineum]|uniref:Uncharacterized protein n=1 Tax=Tanacetum coccineum TaxID=301880 RepID=A0ABQ5FU21_9ASTR